MHMTDFNEPESEALFVLLGLKLDVSGIQIAFKPFSLEMFMLLFLSEYFNIIFRDWALCILTWVLIRIILHNNSLLVACLVTLQYIYWLCYNGWKQIALMMFITLISVPPLLYGALNFSSLFSCTGCMFVALVHSYHSNDIILIYRIKKATIKLQINMVSS